MTLDDIKALDVGLSWANSLDQIRARQEDEARQKEQLDYDRNIQARRFAGFQGYQQDVANGLSPAEAVRKHGGELFYDNPGAMFKIEQMLSQKPKVQETFSQEVRNINGTPRDVQVSSANGRAYPFPMGEMKRPNVLTSATIGNRPGQLTPGGAFRYEDELSPSDKIELGEHNKALSYIEKQAAKLQNEGTEQSVNEAKSLLRMQQGHIKGKNDILKKYASPNNPASPNSASSPTGVRVRDNKTGQIFTYKGNPKDVPLDKYSLVE